MSTEPQSFAPEFPGTPTIKRTDRLMLAVLIFGAFSALVSSYILLHVHVQQQKNLVVGVDFGSGSGLYEFVIASKTGKPSLIPYLLSTPDNKTLHVIDTVSVKEGTYYLLQEDAETANVYQSTEKGLVKITNTKSFKRNLSYDAVSETLAYESSAKASPSTTAWYIYLFSIKEKKEANTQITSLQSQLTTGGTGLFVVSSSSVDYVALPSGVSTSVLHLISPQKTLLSEDGTSIFVFDSISRTINSYKMKSPVGVSFSEASGKLTLDPVAIGYSQGDLYAVSEDKSVPASGFQLQNLRTGIMSPLLVPRNAVITSVIYE